MGKNKLEVDINRYILYLKQIINKGLPCSTGKYIQYFIITYMGQESESK